MASKPKIKRITTAVKNPEKVRALADAGLTQREIASIENCSQSAIGSFLRRVERNKDALKAYRNNRADGLAYVQGLAQEMQAKVLESFAGEDMASLTPDQRRSWLHTLATVQGIAFDKERLERGQSTSNTQSLIVTARKQACSDMEKDLAGE